MQKQELDTVIQTLGEADPILRAVIDKVGELAYTPSENGFPFLVEVIVGQMLSAKAATTIFNRLRALTEDAIEAAVLAEVAFEELCSIGLSKRKAQTIQNLAQYLLEHPDYLKQLSSLDDKACIASLCLHKGIGMWTAKMYLIFVLDRLDILPVEDGAFLQAYRYLYGTTEAMEQATSGWRPYRSIAARYLYRFLDLGYCV